MNGDGEDGLERWLGGRKKREREIEESVFVRFFSY